MTGLTVTTRSATKASRKKEKDDDWESNLFDGEDAEWPAFKVQIMALASAKGCKTGLTDTVTKLFTDLEMLEARANDEKKTRLQELQYDANAKALALLTTRCTGVALSYVMASNTDRVPDSEDAAEAWRVLNERYQPGASKNDLVTITQEFNAVKFYSTENPEDAMQKLEYWNQRLKGCGSNYEKDEFEMLAHILASLPAEYAPVKTKLHNQLTTTSMKDFKSDIRYQWTLVNAAYLENLAEQDKERDTALTTASYGPYKGICTKCGKQGHKAEKCKSHIKCFKCNKKGHYANECTSDRTSDEETCNMALLTIG
jgi:hypothetical protein